MAPIPLLPRLPAALFELVQPRDSETRPRQASPSIPAAIAKRLHAALQLAPRALRAAAIAIDAPSRAYHRHIQARQSEETVPGNYPNLNGGPDPGTVVGIVLGSVAGFLLLLWLLYTCFQIGGRGDTVSSYGTASVVTRKSRRRHSRHHHRSPRRETVEIRHSRPPPERVVVQEQVRRTSSHAPPPPMPPPMAAPPPPRIVTDDEDDEVVVIEEHSPPRRHKSKSHRRRSSSSRRESGFREVDPNRFAGGNASFREVRRSSRH